jgi:hypothetical protein
MAGALNMRQVPFTPGGVGGAGGAVAELSVQLPSKVTLPFRCVCLPLYVSLGCMPSPEWIVTSHMLRCTYI